MVSTIANDGVWTAPRIVAATTEAHTTPQTVMYHPAQQRRVVAPLTAAEMKKMMEGVVLFGTGRKAQLEGYTSAGKTGTAQKVDPGTGAYSHSKYVASFVGFAPVNNPAITVAVILDSAVGLHQGGQVSAPVFQRVAQQVLAYLNVPHDVELPPSRTLLMAAKKNVREDDLSESSPDHLGANLDIVDENVSPFPPVTSAGVPPADTPVEIARNGDRRVSLKPTADEIARFVPQASAMPPAAPTSSLAAVAPQMDAGHPMSGTVILDAGQGGIVVPSFLGKPLRLAVESAQDSGLELDVVGDGIARDQQPPPGSHVAPGAHVIVRFER